MDFVYRLKASVAEYLSPRPPSKRRRTLGPEAPSVSNDAAESSFTAPASEPRGRKAQAAALSRVNKKYLSPSDTKVTRKRSRVEYEYEDMEDNEEDISPDDSISQVTPLGENSEEEGGEIVEEDIEETTDEEVDLEDEDLEIDENCSDITADSNVTGEVVEDETDEEGSEGVEMDDAGDEEMEIQESGSESPDRSDVQYETDEEDAEVEEGDETMEIGEAGSEISENTDGESVEAEPEIEDEEEKEEPIDPEAQAQALLEEYLAREAELALRREEVERARAAGTWHPDRLFLFERIAFRGFEPIIPKEWQYPELLTLPWALFTDYEGAFLRNDNPNNRSGDKALKRLLEVGIRVRDNLHSNPPLRADRWIVWAVKNYIRWSELDGQYRKLLYIPVLVVVKARPTQTTKSISKSIESQLKFLAQRHRETLAVVSDGQSEGAGQTVTYRRQPPLLYGMIVANSIVICLTLDSANPEAKIEHLSHFDFGDKRMGVWNGFALAFVITMAKRYILSIKDDLEVDTTPDSDPDA